MALCRPCRRLRAVTPLAQTQASGCATPPPSPSANEKRRPPLSCFIAQNSSKNPASGGRGSGLSCRLQKLMQTSRQPSAICFAQESASLPVMAPVGASKATSPEAIEQKKPVCLFPQGPFASALQRNSREAPPLVQLSFPPCRKSLPGFGRPLSPRGMCRNTGTSCQPTSSNHGTRNNAPTVQQQRFILLHQARRALLPRHFPDALSTLITNGQIITLSSVLSTRFCIYYLAEFSGSICNLFIVSNQDSWIYQRSRQPSPA